MLKTARFAGASALGFLLGFSANVGAAERWLVVERGAACAVADAVLEARVLGALIGTRDPELSVAVSFAEERGGTSASVRVARGSRELGHTRLTAPSCGEALEAVIAVAALAVGTLPASLGEDRSFTRAGRADGADPGVAPTSLVPRISGDTAAPELSSTGRDRGVDREPSRSGARHRLLLAVGADAGVLSTATAIVGAGAALDVGLAEWRAMLWYGLPSTDERDEAGIGLESVQADFAAGALDFCRRASAARWLSLCAGIEARVARRSHVDAAPARARVETDQLDASAALQAGVLGVFRELAWQPRLELGALIPVVGTSADTGWVGFRVSLGAALPF